MLVGKSPSGQKSKSSGQMSRWANVFGGQVSMSGEMSKVGKSPGGQLSRWAKDLVGKSPSGQES